MSATHRRSAAARQLRSLRAIALLAALSYLTRCTDTPTATGVTVAAVALTLPSSTVREGASISATAAATDENGQPVAGQTVYWSSSNTVVATVSRTGIVTALKEGEARIAASVGGRSATAVVVVTPRIVASVVLTPASVSLQVGASAPLQARTVDSDGGTLTGRAVSWSSGNTAVATVNQQGIITAITPGATTITATSEGRSAQAAVTVTVPPVTSVVVTPLRDTIAVGTERPLTAALRDASGTLLTGRALSWSSSNASIATVSSTGVVAGLAPGTVTITANSEGRSGASTIVVLAQLASTIIVTPGSATLIVGSTQTLSTQITDAQGNLLTGRPVSFSSDEPSVASVSASGVVTALAAGTARITATSEGKAGTATIQVIPVPVTALQITPSSVSLLPGATQLLTVVARSATGAVLSGRSTTWISGAPGVATVTADGRVTAVANGVAIVLALVEGVSATATVTVAPIPVAAVTIAPVDPAIAIGASVQLTATLRDASGAVLTGRPIVWSSADESVAFVSSTGQVVGFKVGSVRITATSEGVSASTLVTVR